MKLRWNRHGVTLLEMLLYSAVIALLGVSSLRVLGDSRVMRSNSRDRATMAVIAQNELEQIQVLPASSLAARSETVRREGWPSGVSATINIQPYELSLWQVDIRVERDSFDGKPGARLTTIIPGVRP